MKARLLIFLFSILLGCQKAELSNDLVGTKWEQVDSYTISGMQYYPDGNWWGESKDTWITTMELSFTDNNSGKGRMHQVLVTNNYYGRSESVIFDTVFDFRYNYDNQSRKGTISYYFHIEEEDYLGDVDDEFGLFFDSDNMWITDRSNVFKPK